MNVRVFLALAAVALPAHADPIDERAAADPRGEVEVSNHAGSVSVTGWDRNEVEVTGELSGPAELLEFEAEGRHTLIKVRHPRDDDHRGGSSPADLEIRIPRESRLEVTTVSANITVADVIGVLSLGTVSGTVETSASGERVEVRTVSGSARVTGDGSDGGVIVQTVSGDAIATDVGGVITAASVSGNVEVGANSVTRLTAESVSGNVDLAFGLEEDSEVDVETVSGQVTLAVRNSGDAEYVIETFSGDINNCFGPEPERTSRFTPGSELRFSTGNGSAEVRVNTLSGSVELCDE